MPLIDVAVRTTIILFIAWIASLMMRRATAATRHLAWTLAVVGALLVPVSSAIVPAWQILPDFGSAEALPPPEALGSGRWALGAEGQRPSASSPESPRPRAQSPFAWLLGIWAAVASALLARIAAGIIALRRLIRDARPAGVRWRTLLDDSLATAGIHRTVRLLVSRDISMPMTWGRVHPILLLPVEALDWTDDRARVVLLHEIAHVQRGDCLTHALGRMLVALHWFNPLAWVALAAMTRERERACDDFVLAHGARPSDYAQHLLDIARAGIPAISYTMAPAMARPSELEGRLLSILTPHRRQSSRIAGLALSAAAVSMSIGVAAASPSASIDKDLGQPVSAQPAPAVSWVFDYAGTPAQLQETREERARLKPLAATALGDPSDDAREKATMALALRSEPGVVEALLGALKDESGQVREKAALGLALRRDPRIVDALLEAVDDSDSQVREKVIIALSLSGDTRARTALIKALDDPDSQVREKAVSGLALFPAGEAIRGGIAGALDSFQHPRN